MRSLLSLSLMGVVILVPGAQPASAGDTATAAIVVHATFSSRTSLKVSTELLRFDVARPGSEAAAAVDFSAAARTQAGAEVVLSVQPLQIVEGPGGAADAESSMTFAGEGDGLLAGVVINGGAAVAGRWTGSGLRTGRVLFSMRAAAAGTYTVPVRFVLSAP
jgi:hypothetical protein